MPQRPLQGVVLLDEDSNPLVPTLNTTLMEELASIVADSIHDLYAIDLALQKCRQALVTLLPAKNGRLDLRFWAHKTVPGKHPCPLRWRRLGAGLQPARAGEKQRRMVSGQDPNEYQWSADKPPTSGLVRIARRSLGFEDTQPGTQPADLARAGVAVVGR